MLRVRLAGRGAEEGRGGEEEQGVGEEGQGEGEEGVGAAIREEEWEERVRAAAQIATPPQQPVRQAALMETGGVVWQAAPKGIGGAACPHPRRSRQSLLPALLC